MKMVFLTAFSVVIFLLLTIAAFYVSQKSQTLQYQSSDNPMPRALPKYNFSTPAGAKLAAISICKEVGLKGQALVDCVSTIECESQFNVNAVNHNYVKLKDPKSGKLVKVLASTDYGICQINDYFHIGPGKDFPSRQFVIAHPENCIRWMAKRWLAGHGRQWVCFSKGMNKHYETQELVDAIAMSKK